MKERNEQIIDLYTNGYYNNLMLAELFNLSETRIRQIRRDARDARDAKNLKQGKISKKKSYKIDPLTHKNYSLERRRLLGLPTERIAEKNQGGRFFVCELVRIRDKRTCQICGLIWKPGTRRLDVHHNDKKMDGKSRSKGIIKWNYENMDKLVTLCHKCHFNLDMTKKKLHK